MKINSFRLALSSSLILSLLAPTCLQYEVATVYGAESSARLCQASNDQTDEAEKDNDAKSGSNESEKKGDDKRGSGKKKTGDKAKKKDDEPKLSVTEHTVIVDGKPVKYKATAGFMVLKDFSEKGRRSHGDDDSSSSDKDEKKKEKKPKALAKMFFIAYTREGGGEQKRPLMFSFNGGPGSSSVWLHMGALGPRRTVLTDRGEALPPPFRLEDNNYSWLSDTDLVFIDPVSTGYSRSEPDQDPKKFHGYDEDIESVAEFIRLYTTRYKRWTSPKFVVGESYGTTRAAGLSNYLQKRYGLYLNGIILVSAVLNFGTLDFSPGNDVPFSLFMPSYTAAAWYHKKLPPELQSKPLKDVLKQAEHFAANDYQLALFQGDRLSSERKREIATQLAAFIGLPLDYVSQLDGRIPDDLFFTRLLKDSNRLLGRFDARYSGVRFNRGRDDVDYDPSFEAVNGPFTATLNDYVRRELHFESELPYEILANVWPWSFKKVENRYLNVSDDLRKAMICNPYLKVWICAGYYDLATPYYAAEYTVDQMALEPSIRKNISITYYESGHMMYVYKPALEKLKTDFQEYLREAMLPDSSVVPSTMP